MTVQRGGIKEVPINQTPIAVVDFETTGLSPGGDRVIEVSVFRIDPDSSPQLVLDTLVKPNRPVAATEVHGITDKDVADAPEFREIAGEFVRAISDCVVASYNIYFDIKFLDTELQYCGIQEQPPHFCLMYLRPMLGLGKRCSLEDACKAEGISHEPTHQTAKDASASAQLWLNYRDRIAEQGVKTFEDLAALKRYKFIKSFQNPALREEVARDFPLGKALKPRVVTDSDQAGTPESVASLDARHKYWEALKAVISDLEITEGEAEYLETKRNELGLREQEVRSLHAKAFAHVLNQFVEDDWIDYEEAGTIRSLHHCLSKIGWAPGE